MKKTKIFLVVMIILGIYFTTLAITDKDFLNALCNAFSTILLLYMYYEFKKEGN